jgi:hypothetical protein
MPKKRKTLKMNYSNSSPQVRAQMIQQSAGKRSLNIAANQDGGRVVERIARDRQLSRDVARNNTRSGDKERAPPSMNLEVHPLDVQVESYRSRASRDTRRQNKTSYKPAVNMSKTHNNAVRKTPAQSAAINRHSVVARNVPVKKTPVNTRRAPTKTVIKASNVPAKKTPVNTRRAPVRARNVPAKKTPANIRAPVQTGIRAPSAANHGRVNAVRKGNTPTRQSPAHGVRNNATEDTRRRHLLEGYLREHAK